MALSINTINSLGSLGSMIGNSIAARRAYNNSNQGYDTSYTKKAKIHEAQRDAAWNRFMQTGTMAFTDIASQLARREKPQEPLKDGDQPYAQNDTSSNTGEPEITNLGNQSPTDYTPMNSSPFKEEIPTAASIGYDPNRPWLFSSKNNTPKEAVKETGIQSVSNENKIDAGPLKGIHTLTTSNIQAPAFPISNSNPSNSMIAKHQQGGTVDESQFPTWLAQVFGAEDEQQLQQVVQQFIQQFGEEPFAQLQQMFQQGATPEQGQQALQQLVQAHRRGGMITRYTNLLGLCPPGYERKFEKGGKCPICKPKQVEKNCKGSKFFKGGKRVK